MFILLLKKRLTLLPICIVVLLIIGCAVDRAGKGTLDTEQESIDKLDLPQISDEDKQRELEEFRSYLPQTIEYVEKELDQGIYYSDPIEDSISTLARAQDPSTLPIFERILNECPAAHARKDVANVLGGQDDPAAIPLLRKALKDGDYQVKTAAAVSLVEKGLYDEAFSVLKEVALGENTKNWELDVDFILNVGHDERASAEKEAAYIQRLKNRVLPHKAMGALSNIGDDRSMEIIKKMFDGSNVSMKINAGIYLMGTKYEKQVLPEMIEIVRSDKVEDLDRIRAITGMVDRSSRDFRSLLEELKNGPNEYISRRVERLLKN